MQELVPRTFKVTKNPSQDKYVCVKCPLFYVCSTYIDEKTFSIEHKKIDLDAGYDTNARNYLYLAAANALKCKKVYPTLMIVETTPKKIIRTVDMFGNTIMESKGELGFIWDHIKVIFLSIFFIVIIALICSGIGSIFD